MQETFSGFLLACWESAASPPFIGAVDVVMLSGGWQTVTPPP